MLICHTSDAIRHMVICVTFSYSIRRQSSAHGKTKESDMIKESRKLELMHDEQSNLEIIVAVSAMVGVIGLATSIF